METKKISFLFIVGCSLIESYHLVELNLIFYTFLVSHTSQTPQSSLESYTDEKVISCFSFEQGQRIEQLVIVDNHS